MVAESGRGTYVAPHVEAPGLGMQTYDEPVQYAQQPQYPQPVMMEESFSRPEPGLDISQFDFVAKAASVYKASVEKDKQRFGG